MSKALSTATRFFAKVDKTDACWVWTAAKSRGYGRFALGPGEGMCIAHRWSYEFHIGPIPEGMTLDHLCRNRSCVNPEHLEPVTITENHGRRPRRTHCPQGHEYTEANTYYGVVGKATGRPKQQCRECNRLRAKARYARRAAA